MDKAIIYFSDKSILELAAGDYLIPIANFEYDGEMFASISKSIKLEIHVHNGILPSIMDAFANCDFFSLNHNNDVVYNVNSIVKIELL